MAEKPKKWIQKAIPKSHKGEFAAKAKAAGETTREYAEAHKHDSGKLGAQARLAETLMGMNHSKKSKRKSSASVLYDRSRKHG
jgi:hypothetical protein